jgi:hypothetical protein
MRAVTYALAVALVMAGVLPAAIADTAAPTMVEIKPAKVKPLVQIAILLDTSNSMDGLIDQAKTQLWKIVNEFAKAQRDGVRPEIQVALYHYGTPSLGAETGYIRQLVPLTTDLDKVSDELFKLKTDGGDEYCGAAIKKAAEQLDWSRDKGTYKAIFIAGNEPFSQGNVRYQDSCKEAISQGIVVNTIFCGGEQDADSKSWKDGAALADGSFMCINQEAKVAHIAAPQDKELAELGVKINSTYIAYGKAGEAGAALQAKQESNMQSASTLAPAAPVERALSKANGSYRNAGWDLVDAAKENKVAVKDLEDEDLPADMRKLDLPGREAYVKEKQKEREEIQGKIQKLSEEREKFLAEKRKEATGDKTLDQAVIETVHNQAKNAGMTFEAGK